MVCLVGGCIDCLMCGCNVMDWLVPWLLVFFYHLSGCFRCNGLVLRWLLVV